VTLQALANTHANGEVAPIPVVTRGRYIIGPAESGAGFAVAQDVRRGDPGLAPIRKPGNVIEK
jgi:hypothetical protein